MTKYHQRDLLLVPVPFTDFTSRKIRPIVVISNDAYNKLGPDLLVAAITSNLSPRPYSLELDTSLLESGTMKRPSLIRADKVFSVDQRIVLKRFGRIGRATFEGIRENLVALLAE